MSQIRRDDRRSVRCTGSSEVNCDLARVRPTCATLCRVANCSGHIDRGRERLFSRSSILRTELEDHVSGRYSFNISDPAVSTPESECVAFVLIGFEMSELG